MRESTKAKLSFVFESAGIEILNGNAPGARLRSIIPEERDYTPEEEDLLRTLGKQIEAIDALEDAGLLAPDGNLDKNPSSEAIAQLFSDHRWPKDDEPD